MSDGQNQKNRFFDKNLYYNSTQKMILTTTHINNKYQKMCNQNYNKNNK